MKKLIAILCIAAMLFSFSACAFAEAATKEYVTFSAENVDESLYDGHWVELSELIDMYLPTDWIGADITEDDVADGLYCLIANPDMSAYVSLVIADADTVAEWGVTNMDELAALFVESGYEDAEVIIINDITTVVYTDTDNDTCDIMISLDDGSIADISLYPNSDETMTDSFVNMLYSIKAAE